MTNVGITVLGFTIIFLATTLGAAMVFLFRKEISPKLNTAILGFAAGVMIAASIWSLLLPSLEGAADWGNLAFIPALVGFLAGGLFMVVLDKMIPHLHKSGIDEGLRNNFKKTTKLFMAVTIHNIPEGLAVGFAFGGAFADGSTAAFMGALGLAIGMSIQNFPEGAAVALPMRSVTGSKLKAFLYGTGTGVGDRRCGTDIRGGRLFPRRVFDGGAAVVHGVCGGTYDFRSRRGPYPRRAYRGKFTPRYLGRYDRICVDDGARSCVKLISLPKRCK